MVNITSLESNISFQPSASGQPTDIIRNFTVRRGLEGIQIVISWQDNEIAKRIRLVRKRGSFPADINDGKILLDEEPPVSTGYIDTEIPEQIIFYYSLYFIRVDEDIWREDNRLRGKAFTCQTGFFQEKLINLLPPLYKSKDKETRQSVLVPTPDADNENEIRNINADSQTEFGELERFLKIFGVMFDDIKCLIDFMPNNFDVDEACGDYLRYIADLVGLEFNFDIPIPQQREEIKNAIKTYKEKGTIGGIETHVNRITSSTSNVQEIYNNVLINNDSNSTLLDLSDPAVLHNAGQFGDTIDYIIDFNQETGLYSFEKLAIYINVAKDQPLTSAITAKLKRTIRENIPADTVARFFIVPDPTPITLAMAGDSPEFSRFTSDLLDDPSLLTGILVYNDPNKTLLDLSKFTGNTIYDPNDESVLLTVPSTTQVEVDAHGGTISFNDVEPAPC